MKRMDDEETWKPTCYRGYEVSNFGRVRSIDRIVIDVRGRLRRHKGRVRVPQVDDKGYESVNLSLGGPDVRRCMVHQLVAEAFIGPRPDGMWVCHNDGNSRNNTPGNLRYDIPEENARDTVRHGHNRNLQKTHCLRGHPYSGYNLINSYTIRAGIKHPVRVCRTCKNERRRKK